MWSSKRQSEKRYLPEKITPLHTTSNLTGEREYGTDKQAEELTSAVLENILRQDTQMWDLQSAYVEVISCFTLTRDKVSDTWTISSLYYI